MHGLFDLSGPDIEFVLDDAQHQQEIAGAGDLCQPGRGQAFFGPMRQRVGRFQAFDVVARRVRDKGVEGFRLGMRGSRGSAVNLVPDFRKIRAGGEVFSLTTGTSAPGKAG